MCEVRVEGFDYVAAGNSTTKKDAQSNACRDFVSFLLRQGIINPNDVPSDVMDVPSMPSAPPSSGPPPLMGGNGNNGSGPSVFQPGMGPSQMGEAYRPYQGDDGGDHQISYMDRIAQQKRLEEAEDLDVNAAIHGNWTVENAKSKLHQFMQSNKINADYRYTPVGPNHIRLIYII